MDRFDVVESLFQNLNNKNENPEKTLLLLNYLLPNIFIDGVNLIESNQVTRMEIENSNSPSWLFYFSSEKVYTNALKKICTCRLFCHLQYIENASTSYCSHLIAATLIRLGIVVTDTDEEDNNKIIFSLKDYIDKTNIL